MQEYQPIENYGIIGDMKTAALIGLNGSIDFMAFPNFDSPTIFGKMLDCHKGGYFQIYPVSTDVKSKQLYLPDTNILLTRFSLKEGVGEILDFMPVHKGNTLIRRVTSITGTLSFKMQCRPRFNYARDSHKAKQVSENQILFESKSGKLQLTCTLACTLEKHDALAEFTLQQGESVDFILENSEQHTSINVDTLFAETSEYWKKWVAKCTYVGRWREIIIRSALVLKLLISHKEGSMIAAPTFSLPETIGADKNWDYRYVWIRDASFVLYSLIRLGYKEEAESFMKWTISLCRKNKLLHLVYKINGETELPEETLSHLKGYKQSSPVRIGNAAYLQKQNDIYGEFMDAVYIYDKYVKPVSHDEWESIQDQINWISLHWDEPGHGIWEIREVQKKYLHTRVMSWVALDRAIRLATARSFPFPSQWQQERDKIYETVFHDFWNEKLQAFVAYEGASEVDASCLLMPLVRFISPKDPRWLSTMQCVEKNLVVEALVYRYPKEEATFSLCSFWYAECLSRAGFLDKALFNFEKMLSFSNHLGLYSEELGLQGNHLGNFPQSLSHLALISAGYDINKRLERMR